MTNRSSADMISRDTISRDWWKEIHIAGNIQLIENETLCTVRSKQCNCDLLTKARNKGFLG